MITKFLIFIQVHMTGRPLGILEGTNLFIPAFFITIPNYINQLIAGKYKNNP